MFKIALSELPQEWMDVCQAAITTWPDVIQGRFNGPNLTLIHADLHPWNIFVPKDEDGLLLSLTENFSVVDLTFWMSPI